MLVRAAAPPELGWICNRLEYVPTQAMKAIAAVDRQGEIRGMVGYDHWTPGSVQMLIALDSPAALRSILVPAFEYPFVQAQRRAAWTVVGAFNERSLALTRHAGFREVHRIRDGFAAGTDLIVFEMHRDECRYLRG